MTRIYLIAAEQCLQQGHKEMALTFLSKALATSNRETLDKLIKGKVMAAISYARRIKPCQQ